MITFEMPTAAADMNAVIDVLQDVWQTPWPLVTVEMLVAIAHTGGYVCVARLDDRPIGASIGLLARHRGAPALHSHVTGLLPPARGTGAGRALKLHQRAWAHDHGLDRIVWTFDPLVRRNAWFNIAVLGAEVVEYLPSFYGAMNDPINAGDESDRLLVVWDVDRDLPPRPRDGTDLTPGRAGDAVAFVPTPFDVVRLRSTDPAAVAIWRLDVRRSLTSALAAGGSVVGFTPDGMYVIGSGS